MKKLGPAALSLLFFLSMIATGQQPAPTASLEGIILRAGTNEPIRGASATLLFIPPPAPRPPLDGGGGMMVSMDRLSVGLPAPITSSAPASATGPQPLVSTIPPAITDSNGVFTFKNLAPGSYRIAFAANGYVPKEFGDLTVLNQPATPPIVLAAGQAMTGISARLVGTGNVSGRVRDLAGAPLPGVPINLYRPTYGINGERNLSAVATVRANDRGEYRIFWIAPGRYYLVAGGNAATGRPANSAFNNDVQETYGFAFYPPATDINVASAIDIQPGSELSGHDFAVGRESFFSIRGKLSDSRTGQPPTNGSVTVMSRQPTGNRGYGGRTYYDPATGAFEITDLVPGTYTLSSSITDRPAAGAPSPPPAQQVTVSASAIVRIVGSDVSDIALALELGQPVSGRLLAEEGQLPTTGRFPVRLIPAVPEQGVQAVNVGAETDGSLIIQASAFRNGPGEYRVTAGNNLVGLPPNWSGWYIKAARLGESDVMNTPATFPSSLPLTIVLSPKAGQIDGVLRNRNDRVMPTNYVVLVPEGVYNRPDLLQQKMTDQAGRFSLGNIAPGNYKLFAWEGVESGSWFDPEFIKQSESMGIAVRVGESSRETINVVAIPQGGAR